MKTNKCTHELGSGTDNAVRCGWLCACLAMLAVVCAPTAFATDFSLGDIDFTWTTRLTAGMQLRTEKRNTDLIDKTNVAGQHLLCAGLSGSGFARFFNADCQSRVGNPAPNRRLVNARGGYNINGDDGNLNYDQGDVTAAPLMVRSSLSMQWGIFSAKVSGLAYHDLANYSAQTPKPDLNYPNRGLGLTTDTIHRPGNSGHTWWSHDARLMAGWVGADFDIRNVPIHIKVGKQRLRWGQSNLFNFQTLDRINPMSARLYSLPGVQVRDAFLPVGMVKVGVDFTLNFSVQAFYQYEWARTEPWPSGSFLAFNDAAANGSGPTPIYLSAGQYPEDPERDFVPGGANVLLDQGTRTTYLSSRTRGYPKSSGQYGLRLRYFFKDLNGGTQVNLYYMNIHSRLPYLSVDAADATCLHPTGNGSVLVNNLTPCAGLPNALKHTFPADTVQPFLDYPEDVHIYGLSFTTLAGQWSLNGEFTYSPNQPAQVAFADVLYAGLQPAFPATPAGFGMGDLISGEHAVLLPTRDVFVPSYLPKYRHTTVTAGQTIRGYERLDVGQFDMTGIRVFGASNPIGADTIIAVVEVAIQHIFDLPSLSELQFEGNTANVGLHYSEGGNSYNPKPFFLGGDAGVGPGDPGAAVCPDPSAGCRPIGPTDTINPKKASRDNFVTDTSFGYRLRITATYNNALFGLTTTPGIEFFHDLYGTSITPGQNFVEGRKRLTLSDQVKFTNNLIGRVAYRFYWGAGYRNVRQDRDFFEMSLAYTF